MRSSKSKVSNSKPSKVNARLSEYTLLAACTIACFSESDAQITYTDIDPDSEIALGGTFGNTGRTFIDLDDDGTNDFEIEIYRYAFGGYYASEFTTWTIKPLANASVLQETGNVAENIPIGDPIGSTATNWQSSVGVLAAIYDIGLNRGNFRDANNDIIAVRLTKPDGPHYGWIRVGWDTDSYNSFTARDFGYEQTANQPILAGASGLPCATPAGLFSFIPGAGEAQLNWNSVPGALEYRVKGQAVPGPGGAILASVENSLRVTGLTPGNYQWSVRARCLSGFSGFASPVPFTIPILRSHTEEDNLAPSVIITERAIYLEFEDASWNLIVADLAGRVHIERNNLSQNERIDLSMLPAGAAVIHLNDGIKSKYSTVVVLD